MLPGRKPEYLKQEPCRWPFFNCKGIIAGVPFFDEVFRQLDCTYDRSLVALPYRASDSRSANPEWSSVEWQVNEGGPLIPITHCATVKGPVRKILLGERVALNILARCSGIATKYSPSPSPFSSIFLYFVPAQSMVNLSLRF